MADFGYSPLDDDPSHYDVVRGHRGAAHHPYAPRGGAGVYDHAYHRYDPSAPPSPPPPSQRLRDRHPPDGGYPPASRGEAVPSLLLPPWGVEGAEQHHTVVVAAGERRLLQQRSPPPPHQQQQQQQQHRQIMGNAERGVGGPSPQGLSPGGGRQYPDRGRPQSSSGGGRIEGGGTPANNDKVDDRGGADDDVARGHGSTVSVRGAASSSIGASIHAVSSSSFSNEGLSNQPSLKSNEDDVHSSTSDSSWRQLQQIASVDKEEMLRMQSSSKSVSTYADQCEKTCDSPVTTAGVGAATGKDETPKNKLAAHAAVPADNGTVDTTDVTTTPSVDDNDDDGGAGEKRDSPGELQTAPSTLSRTSSLSNSPTDDHRHDDAPRRSSTGKDGAVVIAAHENHEYAPPPPQGLGPYHRAMQHPSHPSPPHPQHRSPYHPSHYGALTTHPPPHLHPSRLIKLGMFSRGGDTAAEGEGEDENSPSASTISTKVSRGAIEDGVSSHPRDGFFKNYHPPTPNMVSHHRDHIDRRLAAPRGNGREGGYSPSPHRMMYAQHLLSLSSDNNNEQQQQSFPTKKPKHPVHVKKSREGAFGHNNFGNNYDDAVDGDFSRGEALEREEAKRWKHSDVSFGDDNISGDSYPRKELSPAIALDGCVMAGPLAADGRIMAESPAAASAWAGSSHHSQQSLELGGVPSWETAGKPLEGWSVCSGNTFSGMEENIKDGVFSSAFSFTESSVPVKDNSGDGGMVVTKKGEEEGEEDSSPKSILSKSGEKRKIAPGTHVQFSRDHGDGGLEIGTTAQASSMGRGGTDPRKRSRGMVVVRTASSAMPHPIHPPPPPHHLQDEYYYGDNPLRHPIYHDQYHATAGGGRHPPPLHPSHRHPHEQYIEEDPYYDHYYGPPPPPPPPYGYPPYSRQHPSRHPHHRPEYPPPPPHHHTMPPQRPPGSGRATKIFAVHTPPHITHSGGPPTSSDHHYPPINSQFSQIRCAPISARVNSRDPSFGNWSKEDDDALMDLMRKVKSPKSWVPIAKKFERGKTAWEIQNRWTKYLKPGSRKGQWTDEEDAVVVETVQNSMEDPFTRWSDLAQRLPGRVGKQVRDRWVNHLNPAINHLPFSREDVSPFLDSLAFFRRFISSLVLVIIIGNAKRISCCGMGTRQQANGGSKSALSFSKALGQKTM